MEDLTSAQEGLVVPSEELARQAIASLGGYIYQILASAEAWLSLEDHDDVLLVEVAEDYAIIAGRALNFVQVKNTATPITLRSPSVLKAINSFWRFQSVNPDFRVQSTFLTTSSIGREREARFSGNTPGLVLWDQAIDDPAKLRELRPFLSKLPLHHDVAAWLRTASDDELRDRLLGRLHWQCEAPSSPELEERVRQRMKIRCEIFGILPSESHRATDAVLLELLKTATLPSGRALRRSHLSEVIERATACVVPAVAMRRFGSATRRIIEEIEITNEYRPPLTLRENESGDRLFFFAAERRVPLVGRAAEFGRLREWLAGSEKLSWTLIQGPGGAGKSRLALELCLFARANDWHAGFLYGGSEVARAPQFMRFRSSQPTLIVWDYLIEAPEAARRLIDELISLHEIGVLKRPVRVLLIERSMSAAGWWSVFRKDHSARLQKYERKLGPEGTFLKLGPLEKTSLLEIVDHVLGSAYGRDDLIDDLKEIDPLGRPLFAALVADAIKNGKAASKLTQQGLLNDVLSRETQRWEAVSRDQLDLERHENALALATIIGGLAIPQGTEYLQDEVFPFSSERFNPLLMEEMTASTSATGEIRPVEPDILGEWFVLQKLIKRHPFDDRPDQLIGAAELRACLSADDAAELGAFRLRSAEDFPNDVIQTKLFRSPQRGAPEHTFIEWAYSVSESFEHMIGLPAAADACFANIRNLIPELHANEEFQLAAGEAYFNFAIAQAESNRLAEAERVFAEIMQWAKERNDVPRLAWTASRLGEALGRRRIDANDPDDAVRIFQILLSFAREIELLGGFEKEEVADNAASLGLSIRKKFTEDGNNHGVQDMNRRLWERPADREIDISSNAGSVLMRRTEEDTRQVLLELKAQSLARPDVRDIGFWAANVAYCIVRDATDGRAFVNAIRDLLEWVSPRADWPEVGEVIYEAIDNEWITEDERLGRRAIVALFELWSSAVVDAARRGEIRRNNSAHSLKQELDEELADRAQLPWAEALLERIRSIEGIQPISDAS
jgi:hypothetical protein